MSNINKAIKSVSFNTNKPDEAKMLKSVRRRNFSGYVKKLIWADLQAKEAATLQQSESSSPTSYNEAHQSPPAPYEESFEHHQDHHYPPQHSRNTPVNHPPVDNRANIYSHTYDNNHINYGYQEHSHNQAPIPTPHPSYSQPKRQPQPNHSEHYPQPKRTPETAQDRREAAARELSEFRNQNMGKLKPSTPSKPKTFLP